LYKETKKRPEISRGKKRKGCNCDREKKEDVEGSRSRQKFNGAASVKKGQKKGTTTRRKRETRKKVN